MRDAEFPPVEIHSNRDVQAAWRYHQGTNHSYQSVYQNSHHMDWDNQPIPFKVYTTLKPRQLPTDFSATGMTAFEALAEPEKPGDVILTVHDLAPGTWNPSFRGPRRGSTMKKRMTCCRVWR